MSNGAVFLSGAFMATFLVAGFFFLKLYLTSRDRFYFRFSIACWLIALERIVLQLYAEMFQGVRSSLTEQHSWVYLIRLAAFVTILIAIVKKNRKAPF
jgi:hypothetical protein